MVSKRLIKKLKIYTSGIKRKEMKHNLMSYKSGTLLAKRNRNVAIIEATVRKTYVVIEYIKITTGEYEAYKVIPMEWKYRELKIGRKKVLYAQDMNDNYQIKSFVHTNIQRVMIGRKKVIPNGGFPVKILYYSQFVK
jgi:hypothetical protein